MLKMLLISFYDDGFIYTITEVVDEYFTLKDFNHGYEGESYTSVEDIIKDYPGYDKYIICEDGGTVIRSGENEK